MIESILSVKTFRWPDRLNAFPKILSLLITMMLIHPCIMAKDNLYPIVLNGQYGYIDHTGSIVIPPRFTEAMDFSEGLAEVKLDGRYGFISTAGEFAVKPQFDQIHRFSEGMAAVRLGDKWGYINRAGEVVIPPQFEIAEEFSGKLALVRSGIEAKMGYINPKGAFDIQPQFFRAGTFTEGLAWVISSEENDKCGYINPSGKLVIPTRFDEPGEFSEGLACVRIGSRWGFIDKQGRTVIKPTFTRALNFKEGLALVQQHGKVWSYITHIGSIKIQPYPSEANDAPIAPFSERFARILIGNKWGYIDRKGRIIIKAQFDSASDFSGGLAQVTMRVGKDHLEGYINKTGKYVWAPSK